MATYKNVTIEEMRGLLRAEKGWKEAIQENTKEQVFSFNLTRYPFIQLRVYSGIVDGQSRKVGQDAIRVCAINLKTDKGFIKAKRVHRVEGWRDNLQKRVIQVITDSHQRAQDFKYPVRVRK
jgi:hypothetical protein